MKASIPPWTVETIKGWRGHPGYTIGKGSRAVQAAKSEDQQKRRIKGSVLARAASSERPSLRKFSWDDDQ